MAGELVRVEKPELLPPVLAGYQTEVVRERDSLRATTATLLLDAGVNIRKVQEHRHITTTQIYDKRRRGTAECASHNMPI